MIRQLWKLLLSLMILFGLLSLNLNAYAEEKADPPLVEVEPSYIVPGDLSGRFYLAPYKTRRTPWGFTISAGYSTFEPNYYEPDFLAGSSYEAVYSGPSTPLIELQMAAKYNMNIGSLLLEFAAGMFADKSHNPLVDSEISLTPFRIGAGYILDTLFLEPYISPYISVGAYSVLYKETLNSTSKNGTTQAAPYVTLGLQFQLDWIDPVAARESYADSGIEGTYIFIEGRKFFASSAENDPNFETDFHLDAGLRLEF